MTDQTFDFGPQALIVARLAESVTDEQLDGATPVRRTRCTTCSDT